MRSWAGLFVSMLSLGVAAACGETTPAAGGTDGGVLSSDAGTSADVPSSPTALFVVHAEPTDARLYDTLVEMVANADRRQIELTILLSPSWVQAILASPDRIAAVTAWSASGHELGYHHHSPYHPGAWDGYTNLDTATLAALARPERRLGNMDDAVAFHARLFDLMPGAAGLTATMGTDTYDGDWHCSIPFEIDNVFGDPQAMSLPSAVTRNGCAVTHVSMCPVVPPAATSLADAVLRCTAMYDATRTDGAFAVVTHVSNYAEQPGLLDAVADFLDANATPTARRMTVAGYLASRASVGAAGDQ